MFTRENGIFFCKFGSENDMKKVIKEGPWYMDGKLVVVKKFSGETNYEDKMLSSIPIWVKLSCLPVQWWSIEGVSKVVSPLGHPLYFDLPSASRSRISYARCGVEVAMEKNLSPSVLCVGGDKVKKRHDITYDWVPKRCSACKEFGHMVVEYGGSQPRQRQEGSGGWVNNKKMRKGQQVYMPKEKNQNIGKEGQVETNTQKDGEVAGKGKQEMIKGGPKGSMYKTNILNRSATIKASTVNPFQLLADPDDDDSGLNLDGGSMGNHTYFRSDDEVDVVSKPDTLMEALSLRIGEEEKTSSEVVRENSEISLVNDPSPASIEVQVEATTSTPTDDDPREREARGLDKKSENEVPTNVDISREVDLFHEIQGRDDENQDQESESEEEGIRNYGKHPTEYGMPPTLTVLNPNYKEEIEVPKESKKEKK